MLTASAPHAPFISVITVNFNGGKNLHSTLQNIASQSFTDYEHLVIDGGSTDDSLSYLQACDNPRMHYVSEPDKGLYHAMNKALARAKGEYVVFINSGDKFHSPDTLQLIADTAKANNMPGVVYGQTDIVDRQGNKIADRHLRAPEKLTIYSFKDGMVVCHQAFIVRRLIAPRFDTDYRYSADFDWCIRCLQESESNVYIDDTLADFLAEGLSTQNRRSSLWERFLIMTTYYGFIPSVIKNISFIPRYLHRRKLEKECFPKDAESK